MYVCVYVMMTMRVSVAFVCIVNKINRTLLALQSGIAVASRIGSGRALVVGTGGCSALPRRNRFHPPPVTMLGLLRVLGGLAKGGKSRVLFLVANEASSCVDMTKHIFISWGLLSSCRSSHLSKES